MMMLSRTEELRWGIMSTFPQPLPVMHDAQVFPRFFSTNESLGLPYLPMDANVAPVLSNSSWILNGSLCFTVSVNISQSCIRLGNFSFAAMGEAVRVHRTLSRANATVLFGWWPFQKTSDAQRSNRRFQPQFAPFCEGGVAESATLLPWTGCQSRRAHDLPSGYFTFSPLEGYGNFTDMSPWRYDINPFDVWLLCGSGGSCSDITSLSMVLGGGVQSAILDNDYTTPDLKATLRPNLRLIPPTPVCVWPPFVLVVCNHSEMDWNGSWNTINCYYSLCWNASLFHTAIVARLPRFVPIPVKSPNSLALIRQRRDFGITAAIVSIIATTAVTASLTTAALAFSGQVETAATLNNLSASVSRAIDVQATANNQVRGGLMIVNQRIDLLQEQVDILWQLAQLGCDMKLPGLCVTSIQYDNFTAAANLSRVLSRQLHYNWSAEFEKTMRELRMAIIQINSTRLDPSFARGFPSWVSSVVSYFKEWVGVGLFGAVLCCGLAFLLWLLCKLQAQRQQDKVVIAQALVALEQGHSAAVWIAMMNAHPK